MRGRRRQGSREDIDPALPDALVIRLTTQSRLLDRSTGMADNIVVVNSAVVNSEDPAIEAAQATITGRKKSYERRWASEHPWHQFRVSRFGRRAARRRQARCRRR